jgi:hypothetical protein
MIYIQKNCFKIESLSGVDILNFNKMLDDFRQEFIDNKDVYIKYKQVQVRKHKKKRINKKWLKRYGTRPVPICTLELFEKMEDLMDVGIQERLSGLFEKLVDIKDINL